MTADKELLQAFSNFRGLDVRSSDLTRPLNAAKEVVNFELETDFALGGATGFKQFASDTPLGRLYGVHNYIYRDPSTGEEKEELIALGDALYRAVPATLTISYSGGASYWGYELFLDASSTPTLRFKLYEEDTELVSLDLKTGLENASGSPVDWSAIETAVDAETNFSCTLSTLSVGSMRAAELPLVRELDITASSSEIVGYGWEEVADWTGVSTDSGFSGLDHSGDDLDYPPVTFLNKDNVCYIATGGRLPLMKYDGSTVSRVGQMGIIDDDMSIAGVSNSPAVVGTYQYYVRLARRDAKGNFIYGSGARKTVTTTSGQAPEVDLFEDAVNTRGIRFSGQFVLGADNSTTGASNSITNTVSSPTNAIDDGNLETYYGHERLRVGDIILINGTRVSSVNYYRRITSIDRSTGVIEFDGPAITFLGSGSANFSAFFGFFPRVALSSTQQTDVSTFNVSSASSIEPGMFVFFPEVQEWFRVTATTSTTITIDGVASTPSGFSYISDTVVEYYRTEDTGTDRYFLAQRVPITEAENGYIDDTTDASLGEELILPEREPDYLREYPSALEQHQGLLMAAGGKLREGRIHYEDIELLEGFPLATNFYDVPSQDAGLITALWSDTYDQLAVFKTSAYYSIVGDFRSEFATLIATPNTENDVGISSQASILKVRGLNIGVGKLGFIAFKNGQVDYELTKQLDSEFLTNTLGTDIPDNQRLYPSRAIAVNDKLRQQAMFFIPAFNINTSDSTKHIGANENSKLFILDYSESAWMRRQFPDPYTGDVIPLPFLPLAGMTIFEDRLITCSRAYDSERGNSDYRDFRSFVFRRKERELRPQETGEAKGTTYYEDYADQHSPITYDYRSQWHFAETPLLDRLFQFLKIYAFPTESYTPFTLRIRTYLNWDETNAIDDISVDFTSSKPFCLVKLKATRGSALMIRFTVSGIHQKPTITGYSLLNGEVDIGLEGVR